MYIVKYCLLNDKKSTRYFGLRTGIHKINLFFIDIKDNNAIKR